MMIDWDMILFFFFATVALAIVGMSVNGIVQKVVDYKKSTITGARHDDGDTARTIQLSERTQMIEDRLRVLERIATDRGHLLADEIEALRNETRSKAALERAS